MSEVVPLLTVSTVPLQVLEIPQSPQALVVLWQGTWFAGMGCSEDSFAETARRSLLNSGALFSGSFGLCAASVFV